MGKQLDPNEAENALHAIILIDCQSGYSSYDFAMPGDGVWHSFNHGDIAGVTKIVIWAVAVPLPDDIEVNYEFTPADGKDNCPDEGEAPQGA